jgi:exodeoxyribonuclease V alpha subunit
MGDDAQQVLTENPWALVQIDGIKFEQADEVALRLELDMDSPLRIQGAVVYACRTRRGMGHLYLSSGDMLNEVQSLVMGASAKDVAHALADLHRSGEIILDRKTKPGTTAIYEPWMHHLERECARVLVDRMYSADLNTPVVAGPTLESTLEAARKPYVNALADVAGVPHQGQTITSVAREALAWWSAGSQINLSGPQLEGALNGLTAPVSILTGLPGTGKTTTLRSVVSVLKDAEIPFLLCAPTGIAAKRMSTLTGAPASTIHRAFGAKGWDKGKERDATYAGVVGESDQNESSDGSSESWAYGPDNPHPAQVVIIDESSMVDQHLLFRLLSCTSNRCRLMFVGDAAQLPSVGPGNVLRNMISAGLFPTVSLTEIFRQGEDSDIIKAAHATFRGNVPEAGSSKGSDFVLVEAEADETVSDIVVRLAEKLYTKRRNFQVLSPRHAGTIGVTALNQRLRDLLNPKAPGLAERHIGRETIREDDRIMVVKNNYEKGIFNGDVGKVVRLDDKAREVEIKLHGPPVVHVRISYKDAPTYLRLAYAMTVHKSQGQEYDMIVMPLVKGFGYQLQRNLFYTAITRAKKKVYLVGHRQAMVRAVMNNREDVRNTLFPERLVAAWGEMVGEGGSVAADAG